MPITVAQLKVTLTGETSQFATAMNKADQGLKKVGGEAKKTETAVEKAKASLLSFANLAKGVALAGLVALGKGAFDAAVKMDSLHRGMIAVTGSAAKADEQFRKLEESAKLPGLGFEEAIRGSINLQAAGLSADRAREALEGFGNALATVGKGKDELDRVTVALTQMAAKGKVFAEEINQLQEAVPQIRQIMLAAFGTADTQILQKAEISSSKFIDTVTGALKTLTAASAGIKNDMENAADTWEKSMARMGASITPVVSQLVSQLTPAVEGFAKAVSRTLYGNRVDRLLASVIQGGGAPEGIGMSPAEQIKALQGRRAELARNMGNLLDPGRLTENQLKVFDAYLQKQKDLIAGDEEIARKASTLLREQISAVRMDATAMAAAADARKKAAEEAEKRRKKALEDAKRHADALLKLNQDVTDKIKEATLSEFDYRRYQAEQEYRREVAAGIQEEKAARLRAVTLSQIASDQSLAENAIFDAEAKRFQQVSDFWAGIKKKSDDAAEAMRQFGRVMTEVGNVLDTASGSLSNLLDQMALADRIRSEGGAAAERLATSRPTRNLNISVSPLGRRQTSRESAQEFVDSFVRASRQSGREVLRALLGQGRERQAAIRSFVADVRNAFANALMDKGKDLLKPLFEGFGDKLKTAVVGALKAAEGSVGRMLAAVYQLLAVSQRKRKIGVLSVLGGIAGGVFGGFGGALAGYNIGNALENGDAQGALIGAATGVGTGAFGNKVPNFFGGGSSGALVEGPIPAGQYGPGSPVPAPTRSAPLVANYGPTYVNERADAERLSAATASRLQRALLSRTG